MNWILLPILTFVSFFHAMDHDIHLSKTIIKYKEDIQSWQMTMYVYVDDFEQSMQLSGYDSLQILTSKEGPNVDQKIDAYLDEALQIYVDGNKLDFNVIGKEDGDELLGMWIYAEVLHAAKPSKIEITNDLNLNLYSDQKNVMQVQVGDWSKYLFMDYKNNQADFELP